MATRKTRKARIGVIIHTALRKNLFSPEDAGRLEKLGEVRWTDAADPLSDQAAAGLLMDCDVGVGSWGTPCPKSAELMAACPKLRLWEHVAGTVRHMFGPHLAGRRPRLVIASCKTAIADCVAEITLGQIIMGLRRACENAAANRAGPTGKPANLRVLYGSTVGVVGASEVGRRVIRLLRPFGCRILVYDPFITDKEAAKMGAARTKDLVALCRSHHEGYGELIQARFDPIPVPTCGAVVHRRFLATALRTADILEFDPERTPEVIFSHRAIADGVPFIVEG